MRKSTWNADFIGRHFLVSTYDDGRAFVVRNRDGKARRLDSNPTLVRLLHALCEGGETEVIDGVTEYLFEVTPAAHNCKTPERLTLKRRHPSDPVWQETWHGNRVVCVQPAA